MYQLFQDWGANRHNIKGRLVLLLFRLATIGRINKLLFVLWIPYLVFYRITIEWFMGIELPYKLKIGSGFCVFHGQSLVINDGVIIGKNCTVRHCVTIGNKQLQDGSYSKSPVIGNQVDIGSNTCIIGEINIGNNVKIGAGSVVVRSIPDNAVVVGNPARIIKYL